MHKDIRYKLIKTKYLLFLTLTSQLYSLPYQEGFQIGEGILKDSCTIKQSIFKEIDIKTRHTIQKIDKKIVKINSFKQLLDELDIEKTFSIFKSKWVRKILRPHLRPFRTSRIPKYALKSRMNEVSVNSELEHC